MTIIIICHQTLKEFMIANNELSIIFRSIKNKTTKQEVYLFKDSSLAI